MTARKTTSTILFALTLISVLALSGCGFFSSDEPQQSTPAARAAAIQQAEDAVRNASNKLERANRVAQDAKVEADKAKKDADALEARKNGGDINDPTSKTARAHAAQTRAEDDAAKAQAAVDAARRELETARANLEAARDGTTPGASPAPTASPERKEGDDWIDFVGAWFLPTIGALAAVLVLGGLFWWTWATIKDGNDKLAHFVGTELPRRGETDRLLNVTTNGLKETSGGLKELKGQVIALQDSVYKLSQAVLALQKSLPPDGRGQDALPPYSAQPASHDNYGASDGGEAVDFPITANNFLTRFGGTQQVVKPDPLKGMLLVKDPDGRGAFVLVRDGSVPGGQLCIIPRATRFHAAEDFYNNYEQFYECARPGTGEVWINVPTVVKSADGGWKLFEKGELEVKS